MWRSGWTWIAASERGTSHAKCGEPRQDACRVIARDDRWLIAVACDGAGSTSHGRQGACIAARTLSSLAATYVAMHNDLPDSDTVKTWLEVARAFIAAGATLRQVPISAFATTVVMAVSNGDDTLTVHIGDGAIVAGNKLSTEWLALSWPDHGEYASTTYFLTDVDVASRIVRQEVAIDRLILMTDGLERLALNFATQAPHDSFFAAMSRVVAKAPRDGFDLKLSGDLGQFLGSERVNARTDDDKTLVVAILR